MINRQAAAYWIPAFAGMTAGPTTNATCLRMRAQRSNPAFCLASRWIASLRSRVTVETVCRDATHHPSSPRTCLVPGDWVDGIGVEQGIAYLGERLASWN